MNAALTASIEGERLDLVATGAWTAERAAELERLVDETAGHYAGARDRHRSRQAGVHRHLRRLADRALEPAFAAHGSTTRIVRLSEADRGLMEEVRLNNRAAVTANAQTNPFVALLDGIGRSLAEIGQSLVLLAHLLGALTKVTLGSFAHPARLIFGH